MYPGSMSLLQAGLSDALSQGRAKLVVTDEGERFKLKTADGNDVDAMFFDRRTSTSTSPNGKQRSFSMNNITDSMKFFHKPPKRNGHRKGNVGI